ncbi:Glutamate or tyrosine decarboxylase [Seinonella peptonophila]|uniref:Glutamate or tyrosine decarboxylase n=1 Tax=Seinonella peptonophila TaxID=112248 RepID=A0A1M5A7A2_9BACL|nr:aminotransferase class V-fold PLP-dependent enzyme [Seinonella peptonophila]SHF26017.1 Glutamate or tyrosine decarboxylase [Seinonella peptonophila]
MEQNPLQLDKREMRKLGYQIIDQLVEHYSQLPNKSVFNSSSPEQLQLLLEESIPYEGSNYEIVLDQLNKNVLNHITFSSHPRFFAFVPSPSNFIGVVADLLAKGYNIFNGAWHESAGAAQIEKITIDWFRQIFGMPITAGGLFLSGGSMANLTASFLAKEIKLSNEEKHGTIYYSDQTHSSVFRALRMLGFQERQIRIIRSDHQFEINLEHLVQMIEKDKKDGMKPFLIVGNVGSTNTGSIDPICDLLQISKYYDLWLHVDGAIGAATILDDRIKHRLKSIGQVDSITFDPHKWWFQPYGIGGLLVKNITQLEKTFQLLPEYLDDSKTKGREINFYNYGPELSRPFRALKVWFSFQVFGLNAFKEAVQHGVNMARYCQQIVDNMPQWEIVSPAYTCIINFRYVPQGMTEAAINHINKQISQRIIESGWAMIRTTTLKCQRVLRLCPINPRVTREEIELTFHKLDKIAKDICKSNID